MPRPKMYMRMVEASRNEACLAVRLYNDPVEPRSFEGFVVHMHLAYLYLLHAIFTRDGVDFRYRLRENSKRFVKIDGETKRWELAKCIAERWPPGHPVRCNVEFFIGLRNKIEHRYTSQDSLALGVSFSGHAQALLLNYEEEIVAQFGERSSLATILRFPVFVGSFTSSGKAALAKLHKDLPEPLRKYVADFHAGLPAGLADDGRFDMRLRVVNELSPRDPDALPLQFVRYDDMSAEEKELAEKLGRRGLVYVREQSRRVANKDLYQPRQVVKEVRSQIPFDFNMSHFVAAWKKLGVRPASGSLHPERTDERYCIYDSVHNDYGYTSGFVKKLVRDLSSEEGWRKLLNREPKLRDDPLVG